MSCCLFKVFFYKIFIFHVKQVTHSFQSYFPPIHQTYSLTKNKVEKIRMMIRKNERKNTLGHISEIKINSICCIWTTCACVPPVVLIWLFHKINPVKTFYLNGAAQLKSVCLYFGINGSFPGDRSFCVCYSALLEGSAAGAPSTWCVCFLVRCPGQSQRRLGSKTTANGSVMFWLTAALFTCIRHTHAGTQRRGNE